MSPPFYKYTHENYTHWNKIFTTFVSWRIVKCKKLGVSHIRPFCFRFINTDQEFGHGYIQYIKTWTHHDMGTFFCMDLLSNTYNCGCVCAGNARNVFPISAGKWSRHASRHVCVNWMLKNKPQWNFNRNSNIFIQKEHSFENVVWKMAAILSRPQCVYDSHFLYLQLHQRNRMKCAYLPPTMAAIN